jgi:hypothetical protein
VPRQWNPHARFVFHDRHRGAPVVFEVPIDLDEVKQLWTLVLQTESAGSIQFWPILVDQRPDLPPRPAYH